MNKLDSSNPKTYKASEHYSHINLKHCCVAEITITQKHLWYLDIKQFIDCVESKPINFVLFLKFPEYDDDPREIWEVPEIRYFLRRAFLRTPEILCRFAYEHRLCIRACFREVSHVMSDGEYRSIYYLMDPRWETVAKAAGVDSKE